MASFPNFSFPSQSVRANSAFAPAAVDFSKIGQLYDSYTDAQNNRLKQDAFQADQAAKKAEMERQNQVRQVFAQGLPRDAQGNIDYNAASERLLALDPSQGTDFLKMGSQEADRRADRAHQDRTFGLQERQFGADQAYKEQQLGIQREQLTPSDVREYQFYAGQEREAGRSPMPYNEWKRTAASSSFGKSGTIVQGNDGKFYSVQFGSDGARKIEPLELGGSAPVALTPSRGVSEVDTGTGTRIIDKATGRDVREIDKDIAGAEEAKAIGKETGEGRMALPKVQRALQTYELKSESVNGLIDTALQQAGPWSTGFVGQVTDFVGGSPAHNLSKTLTAIRANLGFDTLQDMRDNSPTGGALGQVSNTENELLQSTWGSLMQSQSAEQLRQNLQRIKDIRARFAVLKRQAYEQDVARFGAGNVPNQNAQSSRPRARNPQTGQVIEFNGSEWVPVQ